MRLVVVSILFALASIPTGVAAQVVGRAVTWSVDGGSISGSGLYAAPNVPGTYRITATSEGLSGTATVLVVDKPTRPFPWKEIVGLCAVLRCERMARAAVSELRWRTRRPIGFRMNAPLLLALVVLAALATVNSSLNRNALRAA